MKSSRISKPASTSPQTQAKTQPKSPVKSPHASGPARHRRRKRKELPLLPPPVVTRQGKTTVSRYSNRTFYRMEELKGKTLDFVEFFTTDGYHAIEIGFADKTALNLLIEPCFTLDREYSDWKTGDGRPLKQWPLIHSQSSRP